MKKLFGFLVKVFLILLYFSFISCGSTKSLSGENLTEEEKLIQKGNAYYEKKNWKKAISYYENSISISPESYSIVAVRLNDCYEEQWKYYREEKNWDEAIYFYEYLVSKNPENADYHLKCGLAYFFSGYEHNTGYTFFSNIQKDYSRLGIGPSIHYNSKEAGEYAYKTKTLNGGEKNKLYITFENAFFHFSKALELLPSWKSYFGMGLIHLYFVPLNFGSCGGLPWNWSNDVCGDREKAEEFFLKSIENHPNWQSFFCCTNEIYFTKFLNAERLNSQDKSKILKFLTYGINLSITGNAPNYVLKKLYHYRGYFYEKFEKNYDLAIKDYQNAGDSYEAKKLEEKISDEKIAKEKGYKSVEEYYAYLEKQKKIKEEKERAEKRVTSNNFYNQVLYAQGIPLEKGDVFTISANCLKVVDRVVEANGYTYLVTFVSSAASLSIDEARSYGAYGGGFKHCFYIITKNPLYLQEQIELTTYERYVTNQYDLKVKCIGKDKYQRNYQDVDCYTFVYTE